MYYTGPSHPTIGLRCERCALDSHNGEAEINDDDRQERHPQHKFLVASIASVWQPVSFGGLFEWLVTIHHYWIGY